MKALLTYSALNCFRNCPRKYQLRYVEHLRRPERPDALAFGSVIHAALESWYRLTNDPHRLLKVQALIDAAFPLRDADPEVRHHWHLARGMIEGYAARYPTEPFEIVEIEKEFTAEIRNPDTGRESQTFVIGGKADGIVRLDGELYLLEHKTASSITSDYLDHLWTDTQIALYSHYLRELGYPIVGVLYNVLLKTRLRQRAGETQDEFEIRRAALAAKNKSGRSTAQRQEPETDAEFRARLAEWHAAPGAFHRERIYLSEDRMALLTEEVWQITQQYLDAKRRGKWLLNTSHCFSFQRPCDYLPLCQSGFNPNVRANLYEVVPLHEELTQLTVSAANDDSF
ncbi:MAG: PD-(D/E)XK nuclease family protein [Phycisphaerae bacterium]|nr:PD-(D/E)XK nuclease family protein [Phycisphaerae bacterium]